MIEGELFVIIDHHYAFHVGEIVRVDLIFQEKCYTRMTSVSRDETAIVNHRKLKRLTYLELFEEEL